MAANDEPLSDDLERVRKLLFPRFSPEEGRERLRAVLQRADDDRTLTDALYDRLRPPSEEKEPAGASAEWARELFRDTDDHTAKELAEVVAWLEADTARAERVFESKIEAFRAGLRAGERL